MKKTNFADHIFEYYKWSKGHATYYFEEAFDEYYNIKKDYTLKNLNEKYFEYCKWNKVMPPNINETAFERQKAYEYLKEALSDQTDYELKSIYTVGLLNSYNQLIEAVGNFKFNSRPINGQSYGDHQNYATESILFDLSLVYPAVLGTIGSIDRLLEKDPAKCSETEQEQIASLRTTISYWIDDLSQTRINLLDRQRAYHDAWDYNHYREWTLGPGRRRVTNHALGEAKNEWRLSKNSACNTLLKFLERMQRINNEYYYIDASTSESYAESVQERLAYTGLYQDGIKNIKKGPFGFCYLDQEEKDKLAAQKVMRKQMSKKTTTQE